jgi:hypothetical protein
MDRNKVSEFYFKKKKFCIEVISSMIKNTVRDLLKMTKINLEEEYGAMMS